MFTPDMLDNCGRVRIWNLETGEWMVRAPVDAKTMIKMGICSLTKPEGVSESKPEPESKKKATRSKTVKGAPPLEFGEPT